MRPSQNSGSDASLTREGAGRPDCAQGFSLAELLLAMLILTGLTGIAVALVVQAERAVQNQLASTTLGSNASGALNQMSREVRMAGYPSGASFTADAVASHPGLVATPVVAISPYDLVFETDINGDGRVERIEYLLPPGGSTLLRSCTPKGLDGTLLSSVPVYVPYLTNVQNAIQGKALFAWETDPLSAAPFPQNVRTVYINLVLTSNGNASGRPLSVILTAACQRMNP